jgi:hypothetical protein
VRTREFARRIEALPVTMFTHRLFAFLGCCALAVVGSACASVPAEVASAKHLQIEYHDFRTNTSFVLGDESDPAFEDLYSKKRTQANVKVTTAAHLQEVVAELDAANYFELAGNVESAAELDGQNPYKLFIVRADGRPYSMHLAKGVAAANKDVAVAMSEAALIVTRAFDAVPQLQWVDTKGAGANFYEEERKRLTEQNKDRKVDGERQ